MTSSCEKKTRLSSCRKTFADLAKRVNISRVLKKGIMKGVEDKFQNNRNLTGGIFLNQEVRGNIILYFIFFKPYNNK